MRKYTTVDAFYDQLAEAHQQQADDTGEHSSTRRGAAARAEHFREQANQARASRTNNRHR